MNCDSTTGLAFGQVVTGTNIANQPAYAATLVQLRTRVTTWMTETQDPRLDPKYDAWDHFPYYGKPTKQ